MKRKLKDVVNLKRLLTGEKNAWRIRSLKDLIEFAGLVNRQGENFDGWLVRLECDIDLSDTDWEPIGSSLSCAFCGEFDGKGHIIRGLRLKTDARFVGLFGVLKGGEPIGVAEVRNLCLQDVVLSGMTDFSWTGAVAGYAGEGTLIENCRVAGDIRSWSFVGGIVGVADGAVGIRECRVEGMVVGENLSGIVTRNNVAGAIAGKYTTSSILRDCHSKALRGNGTLLPNQVGKFDDVLYADLLNN